MKIFYGWIIVGAGIVITCLGMAFAAPDGVSLMTTTPQPTQHLTFAVDDPRGLESQ